MSGGKEVGPVRNLDEDPLDDAELADLAEGCNPRYMVTIAMCDTEELIGHMARQLLKRDEELADVIAERDQARQELRDEIGR